MYWKSNPLDSYVNCGFGFGFDHGLLYSPLTPRIKMILRIVPRMFKICITYLKYLLTGGKRLGHSAELETRTENQQRRIMICLFILYGSLGIAGLSFSVWDLVAAKNSPNALMFQEFGLNEGGNYAKMGVAFTVVYLITLIFLWMGASLFDIVTIVFAEGIKHSLRAISSPNYGVESDTMIPRDLKSDSVNENKASDMFKESVNTYEELNAIVLEYGNLFCYALLIFKCFTLVEIYIVVYSVLAIQELSSVVLYSVISLTQAIRLVSVLISLSFVQFESKKFKESWVRELEFLTKPQKDKLRFIRPIGFAIGRLYVIIPSTILTFFSIMTTHVIVLLQVYSPRSNIKT
jgi:hypothetical protein